MKPVNNTLFTAIMVMVLVMKAFAGPSSEAEKEALVADWERAKTFTLEYIDAMSDEGFFKSPTDGIRTFAAQMLHVADGNAGLVGIATGKAGPFSGRVEQEASLDSKTKVREAVAKSYDYVIGAIKDMDMSKATENTEAFEQSLPRIEWLKKAFEHQTHHRGQATIYLRMQGIAPPSERLF